MNSKKKIKNVVARGKIAESRLDSAKTQNLVKNNPRVSANLESRPLRGAKNRNQGRSSASADFLLEAEKRGSPPKSEKRQLLARRGSEVGGAALLREESSENNGEGIAESVKESQGGLPRRFCESARNDEFLDSSLRKCSAQNDKNSVRVAESSLKIGIVIPIYNVAPYLRECLDSVLNQTYKNFYAVLVNDGSTDNSKEIALEYIAKDSRFTLIDKENGGLSSARNVGIKYFSQNAESALDSANHNNSSLRADSQNLRGNPQGFARAVARSNHPPLKKTQNLTHHYNAKSSQTPPKIDYIIFLDSDDFWDENLLQICVDSALSMHEANSSIFDEKSGLRSHEREDRTNGSSTSEWQVSPIYRKKTTNLQNLDIIWFGFKPTQQGAKLDPLDAFGFKDITTISPQQWVRRAQQVGIGQFWFSWGGMIDFRFLREKKLQFLEGALYEDELFGLQVFSQSRAICVLPKKLYHYRIRDNSIASSTKKRSLPPFLASLRAHFSDESLAWEYACASSFARILAQSVALFENLSDKTLAEALKRAFLPTLFARSCEILTFKCDLHSVKARVVGLLKENGHCLSALKIIAKIPHKRARYTIFLSYFAPKLVWFRIKKRIKSRFGALNSSLQETSLRSFWATSFALGGNFGEQQTQKSSFIPKISSKYKISTANTRIFDLDSANQAKNAESALDSANPQNLVKKSNKKSLLKFLLLFAFAKSRVPPNPTDSNLPNKADSQNLGENISSLRDFAKQNRGKPPCEKNIKSQGGWLLRFARKSFGLPRSRSLARNDKFLDSAKSGDLRG